MTRALFPSSYALAALVLATPAMANVTPEEVWQNWQQLTRSYGQELQADTVSRKGDTLVASGVAITVEDDAKSMEATIDEIRFKDLGDGRVEITLSPTLPVIFSQAADAEDKDDVDKEVSLVISQPGLKMIASGDAQSTAYSLTAPTLSMALTASEGEEPLVEASATLQTIEGQYRVSANGTATDMSSAVTAKSLSFVIDGKKPDQESHVKLTGTVADLTANSSGKLLGTEAMQDMAQALRDGFHSAAEFRYGQALLEVEATKEAKPTHVTARSEGGHLTASLDKDRMHYAALGSGVDLTITSAELPVPEVKLSYTEGAFDVSMPLSKTEAPSDFSFLTKLVDLRLSEEVWQLFDPSRQLPRDPASLIIDTKGKMRLTEDLLSLDPQASLESSKASELHALTINQIHAKVAGAELTGAGDFTFDVTDTQTYPGFPTPTGKLDLVLKGGNALLDKLVAMGFVPEDQAQGARFMLAMFTVPGEGEDNRKSTLEFKNKGFFANGQQLQ